jgi:hypothetical protein
MDGITDLGSPAGSYHNSAAFTSDSQAGLALDDVSSSGFLTVPDQASLDVSSITMAAWIKTSGTQNIGHNIIMNKESAYEFAISNGNELCSAIYITTWFWTCGGTVATDTWVHVAVTYDQNTGAYTHWINGVATSLPALSTGGIIQNTQTLKIGARGGQTSAADGSALFVGDIDSVLLYNRAISSGEVQMAMTGP